MPRFAVMLQEDEYKTSVAPKASFELIVMNHQRSLKEGFRIIQSKGPLDCLFIVAHGIQGNIAVRETSRFNEVGLGVALGFEGIFAHNTGMWAQISGLVENIVVYACNAATIGEEVLRGSIADGKYIMGSLAIHSGATVYAADRLQKADTSGATVDFGPWEGQLWEFRPSGIPPHTVAQPPYSLEDL